jgi:chromosome segregation ATPase
MVDQQIQKFQVKMTSQTAESKKSEAVVESLCVQLAKANEDVAARNEEQRRMESGLQENASRLSSLQSDVDESR